MLHRMVLKIEFDREDDGRWIAEASGMPGVNGLLVYGATRDEALRKVIQLTHEVIADRLAHGELEPSSSVEFAGVE